MKNLKEFKELIYRYETIQLPEIEAAFGIYYEPSRVLTGFGNHTTCTLCIAVEYDDHKSCIKCVYGKKHGCCGGIKKAEKSYDAIFYAETPEQLLAAYRNRAKFMRELLKEKGVDDGTGS